MYFPFLFLSLFSSFPYSRQFLCSPLFPVPFNSLLRSLPRYFHFPTRFTFIVFSLFTFLFFSYLFFYSQSIKSDQLCCFQSVSWGGLPPRGVASIDAVPPKTGYGNCSNYHLFVVFFLLTPCGTCRHELLENLCASNEEKQEQVGLQLGLLASMAYVASSPHPPPPEMFSIGSALNDTLYIALNCCKAAATLLPDCC